MSRPILCVPFSIALLTLSHRYTFRELRMDTSAKSVHEISEQIQQMVQGIEQQAQGAQQISASAEELDSLAESLETNIKRFKV